MPDQQTTPPSRIADLLHSYPFTLDSYEDLYKHIHSHPELSLHEAETASTVSKHPSLKHYTVHTGIGGHGVAGVLSNGDGPTVLLRADMDALPVKEDTGLEYASKVTMKDTTDDGKVKPVMHACGHDMHVTCLLAAAEWLASEEVRGKWAGTLIVVFQPNEERGEGAQAMVDGGLYQKVPVPDVVLGQHVMPFRTGRVAVRVGTMIAAADSYKITVFGRGGHGSMPHLCIDPVVLASSIVMRLQGLVAREVNPQDVGVVTVGSLQVGESENVIADRGVLKVDIRTQRVETREKLKKAVRRIVEKECEASGCKKPPTFEQTRKFPLTINDKGVTEKLSETFTNLFGDEFNPTVTPANASEDVSDLATNINRPYCFWLFGGVEAEKWDNAEKVGRIDEDIPANHSPYFAPVIQPTLKNGIKAMCAAALTHLGSKE